MRKRRREPMPEMFNELAVFNAEVARGIVHTEEWRKRMVQLQGLFNEWAAREIGRTGSTGPDPLPTWPDPDWGR